MTQDQMKQVMVRVFAECQALRDAGQKEYAGGEESFGNFNRLAGMLGINRKAVLMVYFTKHFDGIMSYVRGHRSQREDVRGRINDAIVYLCLLRGMIDEEEASVKVNIDLPDNGRSPEETFKAVSSAVYSTLGDQGRKMLPQDPFDLDGDAAK